MFHITYKRYVENILKYGLIPAKRKGITCYGLNGWRKNVIWLTDSPTYIIRTQIGYSLFYNSMIILEIDIKNLDVFSYIENSIVYPHEFLCFNTIEKERINKFNLDYS